MTSYQIAYSDKTFGHRLLYILVLKISKLLLISIIIIIIIIIYTNFHTCRNINISYEALVNFE